MKAVKSAIIVILLCCIGVIVWKSSIYDENRAVETVRPQYRDIKKELVVSGIIQPEKEIEIKSTISGILEEIYVHEGDEISLGQPLAKIQYVKDPMEHKRLQKELEIASTRLDYARKNLKSVKALYEQNYITELEYENEQSNVTVLESEYQAILSDLKMLSGEYDQDVSNILTSTGDGTVLEIPVKEGGSVMARGTLSEGTTIVRLADLSSLIAYGDVLESHVSQLHVGMPVQLTLMSAEGLTLQGYIELISPKGRVVDGVSRFQIAVPLLVPDSCRGLVRAGCTTNMSVVVAHKENVLSLEENYLQFEGDSVFVVLLNAKGNMQKKNIHTGLSDGLIVEIVSDLDTMSIIQKPYIN